MFRKVKVLATNHRSAVVFFGAIIAVITVGFMGLEGG
jgi:hypothetical protein